ncbi:hypothetical protein ACJ72_02466 [Emergomyces africanus]|uniref:Uncharacterized protein n=1 Tax=Emergomyces africanus TaxID=1955775 RepID=A0A1B7P2B9_9EURO|nr:hypothetical protein ACJ72_02466 [Emergomyces africanus]
MSLLAKQARNVSVNTAGVLVRDALGAAAAHGFPKECERTVNHPAPSGGRVIGELTMEGSPRNIALVRLQDTERFYNIKFQNDIIESIQLKRLASVKDTMDPSWGSGCLTGTFMMTSFHRPPPLLTMTLCHRNNNGYLPAGTIWDKGRQAPSPTGYVQALFGMRMDMSLGSSDMPQRMG